MKNQQKGSASLVLIVIIIVLVGIVGYFIFSKKIVNNPYSQTSTNPATLPVPNQPSTSQATSSKTPNQLSLIMSKNTAFSDLTVSLGSVNQKIGSYTISSSNAQAVNLTNIVIITQKASFPGESTAFKNLTVKINGIKFGQIVASPNPSNSDNFEGLVNIPANKKIIVDLYADITTTHSVPFTFDSSVATELSGCYGSEVGNSTSVNCNSIVGNGITGQSVILNK